MESIDRMNSHWTKRTRSTATPSSQLLREKPADVIIPAFGVYILESHHAKTFRMAMGSWPFHKICWVAIGSGSLGLQNALVTIRQGNLLLLPAGTEHRFIDNPSHPMTLVMACINEAVFRSNPALEKNFQRIRELFPPGRTARAANAYHESEIRDLLVQMLREQSEAREGYETILFAAVSNLVVHVLRGCTADTSRSGREEAIAGVLQYLDAHFHKPVQLSSLAERCGLSTRRFSDLFKRQSGATLVEYLNRKRIAYAQERLHETGNIAYACYEAGFQDVAYFYRVFKKERPDTLTCGSCCVMDVS
jgi:AraC-like DNA-binding protein